MKEKRRKGGPLTENDHHRLDLKVVTKPILAFGQLKPKRRKRAHKPRREYWPIWAVALDPLGECA